jgi:hypothetical protein
MEEFKRLIRTGHVYGGDSSKTIVYVGDGVEEILRQTERNLESKIKLQTLISVVAVYSIVALALPAIYFYFNK